MCNLLKVTLLIIWISFNAHGVPTVHAEHRVDEPAAIQTTRQWGNQIIG